MEVAAAAGEEDLFSVGGEEVRCRDGCAPEVEVFEERVGVGGLG